MATSTLRQPAAPPKRRPATDTFDVALVIVTYQRPYHLERVLTSVAMQEGLEGRMEVIVADDGSTDETPLVVSDFARQASFPVQLMTHPHQGFRAARCRNEGVRASSAPYLLFLDGDCLLPPDHVQRHLEHCKRGEAMCGYCARLDEATTERITVDAVRTGAYLDWVPRQEIKRLAWRDRKSRWYRLVKHPTRPRLTSGNVGIWRDDFLRVNGFDENFIGWGGEDDDLGKRLRRAGIQLGSILRWTHTYHMWHPPEPTRPAKIRDGRNIAYLERPGALTTCRRGAARRHMSDLHVRLSPGSRDPQIEKWLDDLGVVLPEGERSGEKPEIELAIYPGATAFRHQAQCNILVVLPGDTAPRSLVQKAHCLISDEPQTGCPDERRFGLLDFEQALEAAG